MYLIIVMKNLLFGVLQKYPFGQKQIALTLKGPFLQIMKPYFTMNQICRIPQIPL